MTDEYAQLLHELGRLRTGEAQSTAKATSRLQQQQAQIDDFAAEVAEEQTALINTAGLLKAGVPDLRLPGEADSVPGTVEEELRAAKGALAKTVDARQAVVRAGQLPPLLPRGHHFVRNLIVYGVAMAACLLSQFALAGLATGGVLPDDLGMWIVFMPPVIFLIIGYAATTAAGTPRLETTDGRGNPVKFTVYKSPRLGASLAVITTVLFLLWDLDVL